MLMHQHEQTQNLKFAARLVPQNAPLQPFPDNAKPNLKNNVTTAPAQQPASQTQSGQTETAPKSSAGQAKSAAPINQYSKQVQSDNNNNKVLIGMVMIIVALAIILIFIKRKRSDGE